MEVNDLPAVAPIRHPIRRFLLALLAVAILLSAAGAVYEKTASHTVAQKYPPGGRLIRSLLPVRWQKRPSAKILQTVSYDGAGLGRSDPGPLPRDIERMVSELHDLLRDGGVPPPYLLVGHSLNGGLIRVYAGLSGRSRGTGHGRWCAS